jgi:arylsulfatase
MNKTLVGVACLALFAVACGEQVSTGEAATTQADSRPNIVLVMVDDMGFADIGAYGSEVQTPNLDQLADQGMRFNQFRNTSKCWPRGLLC